MRRLHKVTKTERETSFHEVEPGEDSHRISLAARDVEQIAKTLRGMRQHLEPVGDELPQELADLDLDEMIDGLTIDPVRPARAFAPEKAEAESQPVVNQPKQDPYQFMASMGSRKDPEPKSVENPEQETTSAQTAAVSSSQRVSNRNVFNFKRL